MAWVAQKDCIAAAMTSTATSRVWNTTTVFNDGSNSGQTGDPCNYDVHISLDKKTTNSKEQNLFLYEFLHLYSACMKMNINKYKKTNV
eukprot:6482985-Amphidinium_carterae.1